MPYHTLAHLVQHMGMRSPCIPSVGLLITHSEMEVENNSLLPDVVSVIIAGYGSKERGRQVLMLQTAGETHTITRHSEKKHWDLEIATVIPVYNMTSHSANMNWMPLTTNIKPAYGQLMVMIIICQSINQSINLSINQLLSHQVDSRD